MKCLIALVGALVASEALAAVALPDPLRTAEYPDVRVYRDLRYGPRENLPDEGVNSKSQFRSDKYYLGDTLANAHRTAQDYDLYLPCERSRLRWDTPVFVYVHGGGWHGPWDKDSGQELFCFLAQKTGYIVASIDYIMQPEDNMNQPPRKEATFEAMLADIDLFASHFKRFLAEELGVKADRFAIGGESAGGHLASLYAYDGAHPEILGLGLKHEFKVGYVFNHCGAIDLMIGLFDKEFPRYGIGEDYRTRFSPVNMIRENTTPTLFLYSTKDPASDTDGLIPLASMITATNRFAAAGADFRARVEPKAFHAATLNREHPDNRAWLVASFIDWKTKLVSDQQRKDILKYTTDYVPPPEPAVQEHLEWFRDQKLGIMMHFGVYSIWGVIESWCLVDNPNWTRWEIDWTKDADAFKRDYLGLYRQFDPLRFNPDSWADLAARNGFKYLVFTTKHHDGFCMFDSKYSDYKITSPDCPYSKRPHADFTKALFTAFRKRGLGIGAYFSKPDWHHPDFWDNLGLGVETKMGPTYAPKDQPERWERFVKFGHDQMVELARDYGPLDIVWLDGGWLNPKEGCDFRTGEAVDAMRKFNPGMISVERTSGDRYENVVTPEQTVPEQPLDMPWESCRTIGDWWGYHYEEDFKTVAGLVRLLMDVVAKGGNLALNIAPQPDGRIPVEVIWRLDRLGAWLKKNGAAVYATRPVAPYRAGDWAFTRAKDGSAVYATWLMQDRREPVRTFRLPPVEGMLKPTKVVHLASGTELEVKDGEWALPASVAPDPAGDAFRLVGVETK